MSGSEVKVVRLNGLFVLNKFFITETKRIIDCKSVSVIIEVPENFIKCKITLFVFQ